MKYKNCDGMKIKSCLYCTNRLRAYFGFGKKYYCSAKNDKEVDLYIIPKWCPLEDYI